MTVTTTGLTRAAGISAAVAGLIFIGVQLGHPPLDASTVGTTEVMVRSTAKLVMAVLALVGITGMYLRQVRQVGVLGLVGFGLLGAFYLLTTAVEFTAAYVLPLVADIAPGYVDDVLAAGTGGTASGDIGLLQAAFAVAGVLYVGGGLLFGIALFRAGVLARWAAALLAVGTSATLALVVLPQSFNRPLAVPVGVALVGLGMSLWRDQQPSSDAPASAAIPAAQHVVR